MKLPPKYLDSSSTNHYHLSPITKTPMVSNTRLATLSIPMAPASIFAIALSIKTNSSGTHTIQTRVASAIFGLRKMGTLDDPTVTNTNLPPTTYVQALLTSTMNLVTGNDVIKDLICDALNASNDL